MDYEHILFRRRRFHEYGNLVRDFPINHPKPSLGKEEEKNDQWFTCVSLRKRGSRKQDHQEILKNTLVSNKFEVLEEMMEETIEKQTKVMQGNHSINKAKVTRTSPGVEEKEDRTQEESDPELGDEAEDMDTGELDLEGIEKACFEKGKGYVP